MKEIIVDKETIDSVRGMDTEIRLQEIKEILDRIFGGRCVYDSTYSGSHKDDSDERWTDEDIAKLDHILCEIQNTIYNCKDVKMKIIE